MGRVCKFWKECRSLADVRIRSSGLCLCQKHFQKSLEDRMDRAMAHYHMASAPSEHWALECDGSDHSLALVVALSRRTPRARSILPLSLSVLLFL